MMRALAGTVTFQALAMRSPLRCVNGAVLGGAALSLGAAAYRQFDKLLDKVRQETRGASTQASASSVNRSLPTSGIASGVKQAPSKGTTKVINGVGEAGGFSNNPKVRIPLPCKLGQAAKRARQLGQGAPVDAIAFTLNRAGEQALPQVAGIFGDAIRKIPVENARGIPAGGDHATTDLFRQVAGDALRARTHPTVATATESVVVPQT